jgi:predicted transcriptional regulator of viral defense system
VNATEALRRLRELRVPIVTTSDAAALLDLRVDAASQTLRRLSRARMVVPIRRGLWAVQAEPDLLILAEYAASPYPAYVSLQTALYRHAMIEQIPSVIYVVSVGRSARVSTPLAAYSIHHLPPELFGGFDRDPRTGVKLARPEKALFDMAYLSGTALRLFRSLPELTLPRGFRKGEARRWVQRIRTPRLRAMSEARLEEFMAPPR